jgi:hypothetical protein
MTECYTSALRQSRLLQHGRARRNPRRRCEWAAIADARDAVKGFDVLRYREAHDEQSSFQTRPTDLPSRSRLVAFMSDQLGVGSFGGR